ncbi:hypothetical protein BBP40_003121 [Aspergillus hancockii]|nr:hypothetical protein BBP40_003121 [Aspergillus hancockii]
MSATQALINRYRGGFTGRSSRATLQRQKQKQSDSAGVSILTIDEALAPSLMLDAVDIQTKEMFNDFMEFYFPEYTAWASQLEVTWMDFIRSQRDTCPQALSWAIRALTTFHRGVVQGNEEAVTCGRHMYGRGIKHLAYLLQTPYALSDETLAAAILLGGYEILDGSCENSWVLHSRGIRHLMCARGAAAHRYGIGRTLMISFRPFLLAEAFKHEEPCFLGGTEWTSMVNEIARAERQRGQWDYADQIADCAFNEVAKCPGYYAATRAIVESKGDAEPCAVTQLIGDITDTRERLAQFGVKLERGLEEDMAPSTSFVGPTPSTSSALCFTYNKTHSSPGIMLPAKLVMITWALNMQGLVSHKKLHQVWTISREHLVDDVFLLCYMLKLNLFHSAVSTQPLPLLKMMEIHCAICDRYIGRRSYDNWTQTMRAGKTIPCTDLAPKSVFLEL